MKRTVITTLLVVAISSLLLAQARDGNQRDDRQSTETLLKLTDEITSIKMKKEASALERLLTDDFVMTNPAGLFADRRQYLEGAKVDTATYESVSNSDKAVKIYGDAAVVTGVTVVKGRFDGHEIGGKFRFTNVYVKQQTGWKCAAIHLTRVVQ